MRSYLIVTSALMLIATSSVQADTCASPTSAGQINSAQCKIEEPFSALKTDNKPKKYLQLAKWRDKKNGKYYYAIFSGTNPELSDSDFDKSKVYSFSELKAKLKQFDDVEQVSGLGPKSSTFSKFSKGKIVYFSRFEIRELGSLLKQKNIRFSN